MTVSPNQRGEWALFEGEGWDGCGGCGAGQQGDRAFHLHRGDRNEAESGTGVETVAETVVETGVAQMGDVGACDALRGLHALMSLIDPQNSTSATFPTTTN
jgi:hypothetical protein